MKYIKLIFKRINGKTENHIYIDRSPELVQAESEDDVNYLRQALRVACLKNQFITERQKYLQ